MEKEYLGETKSWEDVYKKTKELLKEGKINAIKFQSEEKWEKNKKNIFGYGIEISQFEKCYLKYIFEIKKIHCSNSKNYKLYIAMPDIMMSDFSTQMSLYKNKVLIIICYK